MAGVGKRPLLAAALVLAAASAWQLYQKHTSTRVSLARELLQALVAAGATINVQLDFLEDEHGVSVHIGEAVRANTTLMTLPRRLWLVSAACPSDTSEDCPGHATGSRLLLTLGRQRRQPSSQLMAAYVRSLPATCPKNLAVMSAADRRLAASTSRHAWTVDVLRQDLQLLESEMPEADHAERELLTCLKMSRAFNDLSDPAPTAEADPTFGYCRAVIVPLFDLMNHGADRTVRDVWSAHDGVSLVAARDLSAAEELKHPYGEPSTAARLFLSFGIRSTDAHAVALEVDGMPPAAAPGSVLRGHGCEEGGQVHVLLRAAGGGAALSEHELRSGVMCLRLRVYTDEQVVWALNSSYTEQPWLARPPARLSHSPLYAECVLKDAQIVSALRRFCAEELGTGSSVTEEAATATGVSEDTRQTVLAEIDTLRACGDVTSTILKALLESIVPGVAEAVRALDVDE